MTTSKKRVLTAAKLIESSAFKNLQPIDLAFQSWKSQRIHQENIILTLWAIIQRNKSRNAFVKIHSTKLLSYGGTNYSKYLGWLIKEGFIERRGPYIPNHSSWKYRIQEKGQQLEEYELLTSRKFMPSPNLSSMTEIESETYRNLMNLKIDLAEAEAIFAGIRPAAQISARMAINEFANQSFCPSQSNKTGRVSSVVTYMNSPLRAALTWHGDEIMSVDVVNSQPLCLAAIADCPKYQSIVESGQIYEEIQQGIGVSERDLAKTAFMTFAYGPICNSKPATYGRTAEEIALNDPVKRKSITRKAARLRKKGLAVPDEAALKKKLETKRLKKELRARTAEFFRTKFPKAVKVLDSLKSGSTEKPYRKAAWKLQQIEAEAVIESCFLPLARKEIPVLSVHDCLLTTPASVSAVENAMSKEIAAHLGKIAGRKCVVELKTTKWRKPT